MTEWVNECVARYNSCTHAVLSTHTFCMDVSWTNLGDVGKLAQFNNCAKHILESTSFYGCAVTTLASHCKNFYSRTSWKWKNVLLLLHVYLDTGNSQPYINTGNFLWANYCVHLSTKTNVVKKTCRYMGAHLLYIFDPNLSVHRKYHHNF